MMKRIAVVLRALLVGCVLTGPSLHADPPEHAGVGLYIVALKNPRLIPNVAAEPDAAAFGGSLVKKGELRRLMRIPDARIEALRRHPAVSFVQRVNTGAPGSDVPLPPLPRSEAADDSGEGAWAPPTWFSGEYRYDTAGNISSIGAQSAIQGDGKPTLNSDGKANTYAYDSAGRLVSATVNHATNNVETYTYDSFGNLTSKQTNGAMAIAIDADLNSNRLNGYRYDRAGNLTGVAGSSEGYFFDAGNQLRMKKDAAGWTVDYIYTADDERIGVQYHGGRVNWTFRDFDGKVLREFSNRFVAIDVESEWEWVEDYVYGEGQLIAAKREEPEGGTRHFHLDHLGTTRLITNSNGRKYALHDYYAFGTEQTNYRQEMEDFAHERPEPMRFTGHERDYTTGEYVAHPVALDYMHARYYNPQWGRFLSVDPGGYFPDRPQSWNRYTYAMNNPVLNTDPDGRCVSTYPCPGWLATGTRTAVTQVGSRAAAGSAAGPIGVAVASVGVTGWQIGRGIGTSTWGGQTIDSRVTNLIVSGIELGQSLASSEEADLAELPARDSTGKVHGDLPTPADLQAYPTEELQHFQDELKGSVGERIKVTSQLGPEQKHGERQGAEQKLIKQIDKMIRDREPQ